MIWAAQERAISLHNYDAAGNRTGEQIDNAAFQGSYDNMNRLTARTPGGPLYFAGTVNEPSAVTIQGKTVEVTASNEFSGTSTVSSGTSSVQILAKDYSGNIRTNTYEVSQSGSSRSYTFDNNGNLTGDGARTFEWDAENRLIAIEEGTHRSELTYDGQSRRVRIVEKENGGTTSDHWFLWCGLEICEERDSTGATTTKSFFYQGEQQGSTTYFYTRDHLDSLRELTDGSQSVSARYDYDPYGRRTKISGAADTDRGYTGHLNHAPTGLAFAPFRAYDPEVGRWVNPDPIGLAGGLNLYGYTGNRPVNSRDELGLLVKPPLGLGLIGDLVVLDVILAVHVGQEGYKLAQAYGYFLPPSPRNSTGDQKPPKAQPKPPKVQPTPEHPPDPSPGVPERVNPGRGCNGNCLPCPLIPVGPWSAPGNNHGSTTGTHWHWFEYNQNPKTCECFLKRMSGPTEPPRRP